MIIIDIQIQNALAVDQSHLLVNTLLAMRKSLQSIENIIEKLSKKLQQSKDDGVTKDKVLLI